MISTITLNPSIDKTIYVSKLVPNDTNRVLNVEIDAGGKGINCSQNAQAARRRDQGGRAARRQERRLRGQRASKRGHRPGGDRHGQADSHMRLRGGIDRASPDHVQRARRPDRAQRARGLPRTREERRPAEPISRVRWKRSAGDKQRSLSGCLSISRPPAGRGPCWTRTGTLWSRASRPGLL